MILRVLIFSTLFAASLQAANPSLSVNTNAGTASVLIPAHVKSVNIETAGKSAGWTLYKTLAPSVTPSTVTLVLPKGYSSKKWRVGAVTVATTSTPTKYPKKFFSGRRQFGAAKAAAYTTPSSSGLTMASGVASSVAASSPLASTNAVSQSDIWKLDGSRAYFFNQLRGLQVIDLSNPSNPSLIASYRLPAKGQNLYILPGSGSIRYAVLLTDETNPTDYSPATGVKLIRIEGSSATLVDSTKVAGWLADSRLSGSLLYLATQQWAWNNGSTDSTTLNEISVNTGSGSLVLGATHVIPGNWPVIASGTGWLAVLESQYSDWQTSYLSLFSLTDFGAVPLTSSPVALYGRTYDNNSVRFDGSVLTAVSQRWEAPDGGNNWWQGTNVTKLENFDSTGSNLASLEIVRGETLNAVTYDGPRAYVTTSQQIDPLFVLDLSIPTKPVIAGQVEVSGWSTKIRPLGNGKLFTIGYDAKWNLSASLFDVSNPSAPSLLTNLPLSTNWGYSAAVYDDQALNVLPAAGLVLVPYSGYDTNGVSQEYVQLLKLDTTAGKLALGGQVNHTFDPLRAALLGSSTLASISQRDLVTADISNPDQPALLADIQLAWPVNRVISSGNYLVQISDGMGWWEKSSPTAVISPSNDPESVLAQIPLGTGVIKDVALRGNILHVLRQDPADAPMFWWGMGTGSSSTNKPTLYLDLYSVSSLPVLPFISSASFQLPGAQQSWNIGQLLFPSDGLVALVAQPTGCFFRRYWGGPIATPIILAAQAKSSVAVSQKSTVKPSLIPVDPVPFHPWWGAPFTQDPAIAVLFSTTNQSAPAVLPSVTLTTNTAAPVHFAAAGAGFLVFGSAQNEGIYDDSQGISQANHKLTVLDLADPTAPALGVPLDLPGRLEAVSDLSRDGFLAWTTTYSSGSPQLQVSAYSASLLSQVASMALFSPALSASGKNLFNSSTNGVTRYTLSDQGVLSSSGALSLGWSPTWLKVLADGAPASLLAVSGQQLSLSSWGSSNNTFSQWQTGLWFDPSAVVPLSSGGVVVPEGDYGAEILSPQK